jgi:hypothetical protein
MLLLLVGELGAQSTSRWVYFGAGHKLRYRADDQGRLSQRASTWNNCENDWATPRWRISVTRRLSNQVRNYLVGRVP